MNRNRTAALAAMTLLYVAPVTASAQAGSGRAAPPPPRIVNVQSARPDRAIRRDIPMTNTIRRAHAAGTRDSTGRPGRNYWQLRTDYTINVRLDAPASRITGSERIVITNNSPDTLRNIVLRLDQNIFRAHSYLASSWMPSEVTEGFVISRMTVNGQNVNLTPPTGRGGGAPSGPSLAGGTMTRASINNLPAPILPRGTATLEIDWSFKVAGGPGGSGHRMTSRWADSLYQLTQWYPRVAKYDDLRGWDPEIYLGPSEFYNNFGKFDVKIDVPAGWIVGSTGILQNPEQVLTPTARERLARALQSDSLTTIVGADEVGPGRSTANGDRLIWHFVADTVNDFAWGTARNYIWQTTRATIPGRGAIPLHQYYLPGRAQLYDTAPAIGRHALEFYSKLWMPYAFPQMSMIDGPSTGMEYPMVIMSNEGAADHEIAHSWWPMVVGTNETWYGFMDEGFNQYMNILSDADYAKRTPVLDNRGRSYGATSGSETEAPMMWNGNYAGPGYGFHTYGKTPLMLSMLGGIVGDSAVQRAMSEYAHTWRFKHPSPWDYMFFMNRALKRDLDWFWYYWLFSTEAVHGSIQNVSTSAGRTTVTVRQDGQMPSPIVLRVEFAEGTAPIRTLSNAKMLDARTALVTVPVDVWFDGSKTERVVLNFGTRKINKITLDPYGRFPDADVSDNVWPRD